MKKYAFGVDIGGTTVKMGLFETTGVLLDTWEIGIIQGFPQKCRSVQAKESHGYILIVP